MSEQKAYVAVRIEDELPPHANANYLTISSHGIETSRFFNGTRFEMAHYDGIITHWLKAISLKETAEKAMEVGEEIGYGKGYSDAQKEAAQEIREHYHPNK